MRTQGAEKYRAEVRKANTGMNRLLLDREKMLRLIETVTTIQLWCVGAKDNTCDDNVKWLKAIEKKCTTALRRALKGHE